MLAAAMVPTGKAATGGREYRDDTVVAVGTAAERHAKAKRCNNYLLFSSSFRPPRVIIVRGAPAFVVDGDGGRETSKSQKKKK
jgi:hypothetical protein